VAYTFDSYDNSIVLDGYENGIADSPYSGIANLRNVNITSIPGEASVNFATSKNSSPYVSGVIVTSLGSNTLGFAATAGLENYIAIHFTSVGGLTGVTVGPTYWLQSVSGSPATSAKLYSDFALTTAVTITGAATGSPTFSTYNMDRPAYFTTSGAFYYMQDKSGQSWTTQGAASPSGFWRYMGVTGTADTGYGGGLVYFAGYGLGSQAYVFSFNHDTIDYWNVQTMLWTYGWNPTNGAINVASSTYSLQGGPIHQSFWFPDGTVYFCEGTYIGTFFQTVPTITFDPTNTATYTFAEYQLLPRDTARCLTFLNQNVLVGGGSNVVYVWDRSSPLPSSWILLPENNVVRMVTVNTNSYLFVGNRGRVYITNGTNAQLFKKVPDHISGTIEPFFAWGDACFQRNQLYFGVYATDNNGNNINQYGGLWAIDLDTDAIRLTNELSYGAYTGYVSALISGGFSNGALGGNGEGLYIGWDQGNSANYGIDTTIGTPYTGSQATIDFDLIPIGTFNKPRDNTMVEYKLSRPMVSGESIVVNTRLIFDVTSTGYTPTLTDSTVGNYSGTASINTQNAQWLQVQAVINSTASNPSYLRLRHIRLLGLVGPTLANNQQLGL
jgi:hypothetical protein